MAKPSTLPVWATDNLIASGSESGTPTKVDPGSGFKAQGWVPGLTFVGPYFNWLLNLIYSWLVYLNGLASDAEFLGTAWHYTSTFQVDGAVTLGSTLVSAGNIEGQNGVNVTGGGYRRASRTITKMVPLSAIPLDGNSSSEVSRTSIGIPLGLSGTGTTCNLFAFLDLPVGCTFTQVRVGVKSTGGGSSNPIHFSVSKTTYSNISSNTTTLLGSDAAVAGTYDILAVSASEAISTGNQISITIVGGTDSVALDYDAVQWVEVSYTTTHVDPND